MPGKAFWLNCDGTFKAARPSSEPRQRLFMFSKLDHPSLREQTDVDQAKDAVLGLASDFGRLSTAIAAILDDRSKGWWIETILQPKSFDGRPITTHWPSKQYL